MIIRTSIATLVIAIAAHTANAQPAARPDEHPRSVTLTLAEYNRLLDLAAKTPAAPAAAPVPAIVAAADLRLTIDRDAVRGIFNLSGQVLQTGVTRVPVISGATLTDATAAGRPVPLLSEGPVLNALINGPGPFALTLEWGAPLIFRPGRASFALPVPQSGAARVTIDLPGEQADVRLSAGLITRRSPANGRTIVEATLDPGSTTEVSWTMRDTAQVAAVKDLRALAEILTLVTLGESDVRMTALIDVDVAQGEMRTLTVRVPQGYQLQSITGASLEDTAHTGDEVLLTIANPSARSHQFLVTLERPHEGGTFTLDTGLVTLKDVQRERGEVGVEGVGTLDLTAAERPGVHRIDVRELNGSLHSLARMPILSAFRYQRPPGSPAPQLAFSVRRFADSSVLAAVADQAIATTLVTSEGRALTEIQLEMRNRSQPFLKVDLPAGATIVSVDLAGQAAKPAAAADGTRIPLMRAGLSTANSYWVSFVYVHAGAPFQKKGDIEMALPKMDVPVGLVRWEVFVPEQYKARAIDGNVIDLRRYPTSAPRTGYMPDGFSGSRSAPALAETITVAAESMAIDTSAPLKPAPPSQNVVNLQARAAGVLPIRVDVPRAGVSHEFIKPLVVGTTPMVRLRYKRN
jgi:hypothetical protein